MRELGIVKQVQIQRSPLKTGSPRRYSTDPLLVVDALRIAPKGVSGQQPDGGTLLDVHHMDHPQTRNSKGVNGISLNFSAHYDHMRETFGSHMREGCAGENVLVAASGIVTLPTLGATVQVRSSATGQVITLAQVAVAAPCVEFSRYALADETADADHVKAALQALSDGIRGFYAVFDGGTGIIQPGDVLLVE